MAETSFVNSFFGCINMKVPCLIIAWIRMFAALCFLATLLFLGFEFENSSNEEAYKVVFRIGAIVLGAFTFINYSYSYLYIRRRMSENLLLLKCYIIIQATDVVLLVLTINLYGFLLSLIECVFLLCSLSFYQQCKKSLQENSMNPSENTVIKFDNVPSPPPLYCENDAQVQIDTAEDTRPPNDTTENIVIEFDKLLSPTLLNNGCENGTGQQNDATENAVIKCDTVPPLSTLNNRCENDTQLENAGIGTNIP